VAPGALSRPARPGNFCCGRPGRRRGVFDAAHLDYGQAEVKYRKVLEIDSGYEPALFNLAIRRPRLETRARI
jgi:hypothetical protein